MILFQNSSILLITPILELELYEYVKLPTYTDFLCMYDWNSKIRWRTK